MGTPADGWFWKGDVARPWVQWAVLIGLFGFGFYMHGRGRQAEPSPSSSGDARQAPRGQDPDEVIGCPICDGTGDAAHRFRTSGNDRWLDPPWCPACQRAGRLTHAEYARYLKGPGAAVTTSDPQRPAGTGKQVCSTCGGGGWKDRNCGRCGGEGRTYEASSSGKVTCSNCGGTGRVVESCSTCGGSGHRWR